jgi:hypothetical protein
MLDWGVPQIAQDVIRLKSRLLLEFLDTRKGKDTDMIARDFSQVRPETRPTMKRLRRTVDAMHPGTVHLSWNRIDQPNPGAADRQQMERTPTDCVSLESEGPL